MSPELHALRCGKITASRIADVMMTPDKAGYQNYMAQLVCERLTGRQLEGYSSKLMERGNELEPIAKAHYEALKGSFISDGDFVNHPTIERAGASPDGLVDGGLIEIKCRNEAAHIATILDGKIKREQALQIQWQLACSGRAWCDSISFRPEFPYELQMHIIRVVPDFKIIAEITAAVKKFDELVEEKLQELKRKMGEIMASVNKVILVGNVGKDPEIKYMGNGDAVANFSLATSSSWKDKGTGEKKEETEWHRLVAYKQLAEIIGKYAHKGKSIYVEGRLKTRKWQNKEGQDVYTTEIIVDQMQLLGGRESGGADKDDTPAKQASQEAKNLADLDEDIPF